MGWNAGVTRTTGDLITAADWNKYLGASGSLDYLKTEADKHNDCSHASPARSPDTQYQNGDKIRIVQVIGGATSGGQGEIKCYIGSTSANSMVGIGNIDTNNGIFRCSVTFVVPANWYYKVDAGGSASIYGGVFDEWDLL